MKIFKIFDDEKEIYTGNLRVNTVYFKGKIYGELKSKNKDVVSFTIKLSNGKDPETGEWRKSTFANCTAFGRNAQTISQKYSEKDEIQILCKFYTKRLVQPTALGVRGRVPHRDEFSFSTRLKCKLVFLISVLI